MKLTPLAIALSATVGLTLGFGGENAAIAQQMDDSAGNSQLLAQFRVNTPGPGGINIDVGGGSSDSNNTEDTNTSDSQPENNQSAAASGDAGDFSGEFSAYEDDFNGFAIDVPVEFTLSSKGQTTDWQGPILDGLGTLIYINSAPIPGVSSQTLYDANFQQYQQDRFYIEVEPVEIFFKEEGKEPIRVPAFSAKEVDNQRGTRDSKLPDDIHRWHLFVFGNERTYTLGFTGSFQTFQDNDVQDVYEQVLASVRLIPIVE